MRIAIDLDDVVIDLTTRWIYEYNRLTGEQIRYEQLTNWDFARFVKDSTLLYALLKPPHRLYDACAPVLNANLAISRMKKAGIEPVFVTAMIDESKAAWLEDLGYIESFRPLDKCLVIASNKSLINADMIIDDRAETVIKYPKGGIIFARPWNDIDVLPDKVRRMSSWKEIMNHLGLGG